MAITSGFFRSDANDRVYNAAFFARYFGTLIGNGVFPRPANALRVVPAGNFNLSVNPGAAWINGYIMFNDAAYSITIEPADGSQNRIDVVVIRFDAQSRDITLAVKRGALSTNPSPPTLTRNNDVYELALADIRINAGQTSIATGNITDQRLNTALCGIVTGLIQQADTTDVFNQYQQGAADAIAADQARFDQFLADLEAQLDGNVATALNNRVNAVENEIATTNNTVNTLNNSRGAANGLATLDSNGQLVASQSRAPSIVSIEYTTPGTYQWLVPQGVRNVWVTAIAGGGGGQGSTSAAGSAGGITSFGSLLSLTGGGGGSNSAGGVAGGYGATAGERFVGDLNQGGRGGHSLFGVGSSGQNSGYGGTSFKAGIGAGGGGYRNSSSVGGSGGGGGAAAVDRLISVTPGSVIQITVGAGGNGGNGTFPSGAGVQGGDGFLIIKYIV